MNISSNKLKNLESGVAEVANKVIQKLDALLAQGEENITHEAYVKVTKEVLEAFKDREDFMTLRLVSLQCLAQVVWELS